MRHPQDDVARHIARVREDAICTSIAVACELRYGAAKKVSVALTERAERILALLPILPLEPEADQAYGTLRAQLEQAGSPIGPIDLLIATEALANKLVLVTDNVSDVQAGAAVGGE